MRPIEVDTEVRFRATFRDLDGELSDPATIKLVVRDPADVQTEYTYALSEVQKESTGVYYYDLLLDQVGRWKFRWLSTGDPAVSESGWIDLKETQTNGE